MGRLRYYDLVLVAIATSLVVGAGIGLFTPVAADVAVPLFGAMAAAIVGHALFVNGPVDEIEDLKQEIDPEEVPGGEAVAAVVD